MVFGIRLSIGTVGEQADNLEVTDRAAAYQDCHGHLWAPYHIGPNSSQVASSPSGDLFICAKDLFVEATQASKPCHSTGSSTATTIKSQSSSSQPIPSSTQGYELHLNGLDQGEFTEGHELDRKMRVSSNARPS